MEDEIKTTTTSNIPWKDVKELVNECIESGSNIDINCYADGSWNIAIYPPEKKTTITVPFDDGITTTPYIQPASPYVAPVDPITITCNTGESNV